VYIILVYTNSFSFERGTQMPFNPNPTGYFPNINTTGVLGGVTGVFIPYSDLESYDYAVATGVSSGDIRQLVYSVNEAVADVYLGLSTGDRPTQMTYSRSASVPSDALIRKTYTIVMNLNLPDTSVASE